MIGGRGHVVAGSGVVLLALTALALVVQWRDDLHWFLVVAAFQSAAYAVAVWAVWRGPSSRRLVFGIGAVALLMRLAVLCLPPYLSSDIYRYIWDGRVAAAGIDPYRYVPADPHLAALRDAEIFPQINRAETAVTIYPPVAEAIFFGVTRISESVTAMKAAMVGFEIATFLLLLYLLGAEQVPSGRVLVYAWHPLPLWEFAGSGHIDAALVTFTAAALVLARAHRGTGAGFLLAAATLTKLYPAVLLPALWGRGWAMPAAFVAGIMIGYLPFVMVGAHAIGFLPGYAAEEGFNTGGAGFYLLGLLRELPGLSGLAASIYILGALAALTALAAAVFFTSRYALLDGAVLLAIAFVMLISPHYAWYFPWLIVFACFVQPAALLWLTTACLLLYLVPVWSQIVRDPFRLIIESIIYAPFAALALGQLWYDRRNASRTR